MEVFELWARACVDAGTELWKFEGDGGTGLYMTKTPEIRGNVVWWATPVYHVWINGKCILSTENYQEAIKAYENQGAVSRRH